MSIYQIRQGTCLHSRTTQWISHRIRLTFTSITVHTHTHCHWHAHLLIIISSADHSPWAVRLTRSTTTTATVQAQNSKQHRHWTASSRHAAADSRHATNTGFLNIKNCMNFRKFTHTHTHTYTQNISLHIAMVVRLPCNGEVSTATTVAAGLCSVSKYIHC